MTAGMSLRQLWLLSAGRGPMNGPLSLHLQYVPCPHAYDADDDIDQQGFNRYHGWRPYMVTTTRSGIRKQRQPEKSTQVLFLVNMAPTT